MISGAVACVASCIVVDIHDVDKLVHGEDAPNCYNYRYLFPMLNFTTLLSTSTTVWWVPSLNYGFELGSHLTVNLTIGMHDREMFWGFESN
ncbi:hypothetical protein ACSQ67_018806 [Phaseolus vulgaris]